jgi:hypothetical protein
MPDARNLIKANVRRPLRICGFTLQLTYALHTRAFEKAGEKKVVDSFVERV